MQYSLNDFIKLKVQRKNEINVSIVSSSMEPWIHKGETVILKPCNVEDIQPYDVIVFWSNNKLICHVYIKEINNFLITKPLLNETFDIPTNSKYLLGKVTSPHFSWYHKLVFKYLK